jgi:23S rRNA pseudouridine2605 synthase
LILEGRVEVDGKVVEALGTQVDPQQAKIYVDGTLLKKQRLVYFVLNKPPGVVTSNRDPQGRTRVIDLIQEKERVFPVGRLDRSSEGLLFMTNDGDLAQQLAHPKYGVRKTYRVTVAGKVDTSKLAQMRKGIYIAEGHVSVDGARIIRHRAKSTDLEILLREGKNREIRRILARLGHKVMTLQRVALGPLRLGELPRGAYRPVSGEELRRLRDEVFYQSKARGAEVPDDAGESNAEGATRGAKKRAVPKGAIKKRSIKKGGVKKVGFEKRPVASVPPRKKPLEGSKKVGIVIGAEDITEVPFDAQRIPRPKGKKARPQGSELKKGRGDQRDRGEKKSKRGKGSGKS